MSTVKTLEESPGTSYSEASRLDVVQGFLNMIADGSLRVGNKTSEPEIASRLGLKRGPVVREALALLTRDGIVQPLPQRGYLIRQISVEEAWEILRLRAASEKIVIEKLSTIELGSRLNRARDLQAQLGKLAKDFDAGGFLNIEGRLCRELARLSNLFTAVQVIGAWSDQLRVFYAAAPPTAHEMGLMLNGYDQILAAITAGDSDRAIAALDTQVEARIALLSQAVAAPGVGA